MIYVVSGYMRTGTSMMMQALASGGLSAAYSDDREDVLSRLNDESYVANKHFLEIPLHEYESESFPLQYEGKLIKVMQWALSGFAQAKYRIVLMHRDWEEVRQSHFAAFGTFPRHRNAAQYDEAVRYIAHEMQERSDCTLHVVEYSDAIANPLATMRTLKDSGWEIDAEHAASAVDSRLYRFRSDRLLAGAGGGHGVA